MNKTALIGGALATGAIAYFLSTEKGKQVKQDLLQKGEQLIDELNAKKMRSQNKQTNYNRRLNNHS